MVNLLLSVGADPTVVDRTPEQQLPLHLAAAAGHLAVVEILIQRDPPLLDKADKKGQTLLRLAMANKHKDVVTFFGAFSKSREQEASNRKSFTSPLLH
ncbi:MAG: transient receptor potential cation channel subfamily er 1-like isoform [Gammaproteobacteria bacterium]|jgi:ankyrin repeat protein|nr:transient receptor potential cation channel subfamily er 1-like isoform [Gammaproteobacteria bacterium]